MSLASFAGAIFVGLLAGNDPLVILVRAMVVMVLAWIVGRLVGALAMHFVVQSIDAYKEAHPIPTETDEQADEEVIEATRADEEGMQAGPDPTMADVTDAAAERQAA